MKAMHMIIVAESRTDDDDDDDGASIQKRLLFWILMMSVRDTKLAKGPRICGGYGVVQTLKPSKKP